MSQKEEELFFEYRYKSVPQLNKLISEHLDHVDHEIANCALTLSDLMDDTTWYIKDIQAIGIRSVISRLRSLTRKT